MSGDLLALGAIAALAGVAWLRSEDVEVLYAMPYGDAARPVARALKTADPTAVQEAVALMAPLVSSNRPVYVPVPGSSGDTTANRALARALVARTGGMISDVLGRERPVQSSYKRFYEGKDSLSPSEHHMVLRGWPPIGDVYLVDNVATTGNTLRAARAVIGRGRGRVFAAELAALERGSRFEEGGA